MVQPACSMARAMCRLRAFTYVTQPISWMPQKSSRLFIYAAGQDEQSLHCCFAPEQARLYKQVLRCWPERPYSGDTPKSNHHHHHQVPDLEQTLATMPLQTSLSSDNFKKFKPLLCPPVAELQRLSRNVIRCLPLSRLPSTLPVKDKNSKPLRLHTCPKNSICLFLIVFNSDL